MGAVDDDRPVEIMSEPDPDQPGAWRGTGAAPPMAANMMMRLMASGMSSQGAAEILRDFHDRPDDADRDDG